jgi:hypothetical protein
MTKSGKQKAHMDLRAGEWAGFEPTGAGSVTAACSVSRPSRCRWRGACATARRRPTRRLGGQGLRLVTRSCVTPAFWRMAEHFRQACACGRTSVVGESRSRARDVREGFGGGQDETNGIRESSKELRGNRTPCCHCADHERRRRRGTRLAQGTYAPREFSTSPYPLAGFAQVGYRSVSWESKFANGFWGRSTWGRKQNRGLFDDRWKQLVS